MKDDVSFVSLGATFHPDDASSVATTETERGWSYVLAEAVVLPHESDLPVAEAVTVDEEAFASPPATEPTPVSSVHRCNFLVIVIGYAFLIFAAATAFGTELAAAALYLVGVGFYQTSEGLKECLGPSSLPFQTLFLMLTSLMLSMDLLILTIGIFFVEIMAWIACGLCILFGGIATGSGWHQHIRKVCHLTRWAFRRFHSSWTPKRLQPFNKTAADGETAVAEQHEQSANSGAYKGGDTFDHELAKDGIPTNHDKESAR